MEKEQECFERAFEAVMTSDIVPMDAMLRHVTSVRGKRLRPRLVFLSARLFGEVNDITRHTALFVELFHTATLIHDDVVDGSDIRRGQASVNARWDSRAAVLAGDYLLAKAMAQLSEPSDHPILKEMLNVAMAMSEGELLQAASPLGDASSVTAESLQPTASLPGDASSVTAESLQPTASPSGDASSVTYMEVIERKTARLIRACCVGGALSVGASSDAINIIGDFGLNLGLVFQMRDDILDNDDSTAAALARQLLPEYLDKALKALDTLAPYTKDKEAQHALRELTLFCAERES